MEEKNLGNTISKLRKEKNMTQLDLAKKLNVTDKAVSKWERGISYPDITTISTLAKVLEVDVSELITLCKKEENPYKSKEDTNKLIDTILIIIPFALSIALIVFTIIGNISTEEQMNLITIAILANSIYNLRHILESKKY